MWHSKLVNLLCICLLYCGFSHAAVPKYSISQIEHNIAVSQYAFIDDPNFSPDKLISTNEQLWLVNKNAQYLQSKPQGRWIRIDIVNDKATHQTVYLVLDRRIMVDYSSAYVKNGIDNFITQPLLPQLNNHYYTSLTIAGNQSAQIILKLTSDTSLEVSATLMNYQHFVQQTAVSHSYTGLAIGIMLSFGLIQLLLFFGSGQYSNALLSGYFFARSLLLAAILGWNASYFLPQYPELKGAEYPILISISTAFLLYFIRALFKLKRLHNQLDKTIKLLTLALIVYIPVSYVFSSLQNVLVSIVIYLCATLILTIIAFALIKKQIKLAKLLGLICVLELLFLMCVLTALLWYQSGLFEHRRLLYSFGFTINGLVITYLMGKRAYYQTQKRIAAQQQALDHALASQQAQEQLLTLQQKNQEEMEQQVQERTLELNIALQELEQANEELERKNMLDEMTGLYNRRFYDQRIMAEYRRSKRNLTPLSLIILDIDHFKSINDTYGHLAGDYCLEQVASIIKHAIKRSTDVGCRYGGEEFCLILPDTEAKGAIELAENIRSAVEKQQIQYNDQTIQFTISCGIATYQQQPNMQPSDLFAAADAALYYAKEHGRNQVHFHQDKPLIQENDS